MAQFDIVKELLRLSDRACRNNDDGDGEAVRDLALTLAGENNRVSPYTGQEEPMANNQMRPTREAIEAGYMKEEKFVVEFLDGTTRIVARLLITPLGMATMEAEMRADGTLKGPS